MKAGFSTALGDAPELAAILECLRDKGLTVVVGRVPVDALLPAMTVQRAVLLYDPARLDTLAKVRDNPAVEMAAIARSYAAAMLIGVPIGTLFHTDYKGGPDSLTAAFASGGFIGLSMLQLWGMAVRDDGEGAYFPAIRAWLRPARARRS